MPDQNVESVVSKLRSRVTMGRAKYGVTTERDDFDPVDWLQSLQGELMDATVYIEALIRSSSDG